MSLNRTRRAFATALGSAALLAACGGGTVASQFTPSRILVFGDATADLGQNGTRYTVNNGSINIWTLELASRFGVALATQAAGGTSYATGNARVIATPDAVGNGSTPTVKQQIDAFLASGRFGPGDLVIVSAGVSDLIVQSTAAFAGTQTFDQARANIEQAGRDLAGQVRRLVDAGATHVLLAGPHNLGRTPWATAIGQSVALETWSVRFNDVLLVTIVDLGTNVLYVDRALFVNLMTAGPGGYSMSNGTTAVCTVGPDIGIGSAQLPAGVCDLTKVVGDPEQYVYADPVHLTPHANREFGDYAYDRLRLRW